MSSQRVSTSANLCLLVCMSANIFNASMMKVPWGSLTFKVLLGSEDHYEDFYLFKSIFIMSLDGSTFVFFDSFIEIHSPTMTMVMNNSEILRTSVQWWNVESVQLKIIIIYTTQRSLSRSLHLSLCLNWSNSHFAPHFNMCQCKDS